MKQWTKKQKWLAVLLAAALVLCGWLFGWWRGGTIDVLDFTADDVEQVVIGAQLPRYVDGVIIVNKEEIQDIIDQINSLTYTGKSVRYLPIHIFAGNSVLYDFAFYFPDGTHKTLVMFPTARAEEPPVTDMEVTYLFHGSTSPRFTNTARGSLQFFYNYYEAYNGSVDEEALMEQYGS